MSLNIIMQGLSFEELMRVLSDMYDRGKNFLISGEISLRVEEDHVKEINVPARRDIHSSVSLRTWSCEWQVEVLRQLQDVMGVSVIKHHKDIGIGQSSARYCVRGTIPLSCRTLDKILAFCQRKEIIIPPDVVTLLQVLARAPRPVSHRTATLLSEVE